MEFKIFELKIVTSKPTKNPSTIPILLVLEQSLLELWGQKIKLYHNE